MLKYLLLLTLVCSQAYAFYGHKLSGHEASATPHFFVKAQTLDEAQKKASDLAKLHTSFMIGSLMGDTKDGTRGAISKNFSVSDVKVTPAASGEFRVDYHLEAEMILEKNRKTSNFSLSLPLYPENVFNDADKRCTLQYYYAGAEFVYFQFWSPTPRRCPAVPGKDYLEYPVELKERLSAAETYPRYEEMIKDNEVKLFFYFGSDSESLRNFGEAGKGYDTLKYWLKKQRFTFVKASNRWEKQTGNVKLAVKLLLGNPLPNTPDSQEEYYWFMKEAYETGAYVQYTGHAGHGGIMDLSKLGEKLNSKVEFPKERYQIYYINGCQTYIYATNYFPQLKGGYKNLHMLLNGDVSWPDTTWINLEAPLDMLYDYFNSGKRTSFQSMINESSLKMDRKLGAYRHSPMLVLEGEE